MKKIYVLDTSVCLSDSNCIFDYDNNDVIIPLKVLEEIGDDLIATHVLFDLLHLLHLYSIKANELYNIGQILRFLVYLVS